MWKELGKVWEDFQEFFEMGNWGWSNNFFLGGQLHALILGLYGLKWRVPYPRQTCFLL